MATGKCLYQHEYNLLCGCKYVEFSFDGSYLILVGYDNKLRIRQVRDNRDVLVIYMENINKSFFSQNNEQVIVCKTDGTVVIIDFPPLQILIDRFRARFIKRYLTQDELNKYNLK